MGNFCTKIPWRFLCKSLWLGDYRGHISLAYPGTIPGAVNTLGGGSGLPERQIGRPARQAVAAADPPPAAGGRGGRLQWGQRSACRSDGRQVGGRLRQSAGRPAIRQRRQPGGRRRYQTRRPAQEYHAAQAHRRSASASHPPPERPAIRQRRQPAGRRRYQTPAPAKIPRRACPREILNALARGTGGAAVVPLRVRKPKIFLGKGSKNRFRNRGGKSWRGQKCDRGRKRGGFGQKRSRLCGGFAARTAAL